MLQTLFMEKPYQGCSPLSAEFLFIGLDANYSANIEEQSIFSRIIEYHTNSVDFWKNHNLHHPFLLSEYKGDGRKYHHEFSKIGLTSKFAEKISFIELLHLPTTGRNRLTVEDLDINHLKYIHDSIFSESKKAVFISDSVFKLMKKTNIFSWISYPRTIKDEPLEVFYNKKVKIYKHLHFSTYGKFQNRKSEEAKAISYIINHV